MTPETALSTRLQDDKTWRIRELSELVRACKDATGVRQDALLRASVPVLYAHWEGYFVIAANTYLTFITEKHVNIDSLKDEFWSLAIRRRYKPNQLSSDKLFARFLIDIRLYGNRVFKKGNFDRINGQSNLNSDVLSFCCSCIGLSHSAFDSYKEFIDKDLIDKRNHIAHGSSLRFDADLLVKYRDNVVDLLRLAQTEIENAAVSGAYFK